MASDQLVPDDIGTVDWNGGKAPPGGSHTGTSIIVMVDGATFTVAHSVADVLARTNSPSSAPGTPQWVAFDLPNSPVPVVLNVQNISTTRSVNA